MWAGFVCVRAGLGFQTLPITGWTVKTVAVPLTFVIGACSGLLQSSGAPGLIGSYRVRRWPTGPSRCQRMKSPVRSRGANPGGAWLCIAALVVTTHLNLFITNGGTLSQSNFAFRSVAR